MTEKEKHSLVAAALCSGKELPFSYVDYTLQVNNNQVRARGWLQYPMTHAL